MVRELQNWRAARAMGLQAKYIKVWLHNVVQEEMEATNVVRGGFNWHIFIKLIQSIWEHGCLPEQ